MKPIDADSGWRIGLVLAYAFVIVFWFPALFGGRPQPDRFMSVGTIQDALGHPHPNLWAPRLAIALSEAVVVRLVAAAGLFCSYIVLEVRYSGAFAARMAFYVIMLTMLFYLMISVGALFVFVC